MTKTIYVLQFDMANGEPMTLHFDNSEAFDKAEAALQVEIGKNSPHIKNRWYRSSIEAVYETCDDTILGLIRNPLY